MTACEYMWILRFQAHADQHVFSARSKTNFSVQTLYKLFWKYRDPVNYLLTQPYDIPRVLTRPSTSNIEFDRNIQKEISITNYLLYLLTSPTIQYQIPAASTKKLRPSWLLTAKEARRLSSLGRFWWGTVGTLIRRSPIHIWQVVWLVFFPKDRGET